MLTFLFANLIYNCNPFYTTIFIIGAGSLIFSNTMSPIIGQFFAYIWMEFIMGIKPGSVIRTGERTAKVVTKVVLFWIECIDIDIPQPLTFTPVQFGKYSFNNKNYQR
jgi:hypothetical protein